MYVNSNVWGLTKAFWILNGVGQVVELHVHVPFLVFHHNRANLCGVTRCAYLELLTSLLDQQTRTAALNVFQEARQCLLDSMIGESAPMLEDVLVSSCKFLFTCTSQFTKSTNTIPQTMDLCSECLRHDSVAVRQYTLQFILSSSDLLADNGLTSQLVKLFSTEQDESVLTLLCSVLIKAVEKQRCEMEMELYTAAFQHATKTHLRYMTSYM